MLRDFCMKGHCVECKLTRLKKLFSPSLRTIKKIQFLTIRKFLKIEKFQNCPKIFKSFQIQWRQKISILFSREERHFLYFNHLSKEFLKQMIPHLKALIQGFQNQQKNWAWHHPEGGHAPLTEKALLLLELVWSLS